MKGIIFFFTEPSVECYDVTTKEWKFVASMNHARRYVAAAALGGLLYAVGGYDGISVLDTVEAYDPKLDQWKRVESMSNARRHVAVGVLENDENDGSGPGNLKKNTIFPQISAHALIGPSPD